MSPTPEPAAIEAARRAVEEPVFAEARAFAVGPGPELDADARPRAARATALGPDAALVWFVGRHYPIDLAVEVARGPDGWRAVFAQADAHARVALRILSPGLPPDAITAVLGLSPSREARAGRALDDGPSARREHLWLRDVLPDFPASVEEKLADLLGLLEPRAEALRALAPRVDASVSVAYHAAAERMQGLALPAELMLRLGALGLRLDLDLYAETLGTPPSGEPDGAGPRPPAGGPAGPG